jgi:hypothetical protein
MDDPITEAWLKLAIAVVKGFDEDDPERKKWVDFGRELLGQRQRLHKSFHARPIGHMSKDDVETESIASIRTQKNARF